MKRTTEMLRVYDPRLGEDFRAVNALTGNEFSSLEAGMIVFDWTGDMYWGDAPRVLAETASRLGLALFAIFSPWSPGLGRARGRIHSEFGGEEIPNGIFVVPASDPARAMSAMLDLYGELGGSKAGELLIGGVAALPPVQEGVARNHGGLWGVVLDTCSLVRFFLFLGEMQRGTIAFRLIESTVEPADRIRRLLEHHLGSSASQKD